MVRPITSAVGPQDTVLANVVTNVSVTGTTNKTPLATVGIPGGLLDTCGGIEIEIIYFISVSANGKEFIIDYGGTEFFHVGHTTGGYYKFNTVIRNNKSLAVQQALNPDSSAGAANLKNGTVNSALDQNLVLSGQCLNAADTVTLIGYTVKVFNPL